MKYCSFCGTQMDDTTLFCPSCGREQNAGQGYYARPVWYAPDDNKPHPWIAIISFLIKPLALILFLLWRYDKPSRARAAAKGGFYSLSFSYPFVGLILFLIFKDSRRDTAKWCGIFAVIGFSFSFILTIALFVLQYTYGITFDFFDAFESGISLYIK